MKKRVRSDRETQLRVRNFRRVGPFPTADILHIRAAKTSTPAIGGRKVSKPQGSEGYVGAAITPIPPGMAGQLPSGHCLRGVGRFRRMQLPCLTDTIEPYHCRPADAAAPQMASPQWVMPAAPEGFGGSQGREEVAAVVKFLPSLSRRLVVMRIWQACDRRRPGIRALGARRTAGTSFRNDGSESRPQTRAKEIRAWWSPACFS